MTSNNCSQWISAVNTHTRRSANPIFEIIRFYYIYPMTNKTLIVGPYAAYRQTCENQYPQPPQWFHNGWWPCAEQKVQDAMLDNALMANNSLTYCRIPHYRIMRSWIHRNLFDIEQAITDRRSNDEIDFCIHVEETESGFPIIRYVITRAYSVDRNHELVGGWMGPWTVGAHRLEYVLRATGFESLEQVSESTFKQETLQYHWYQYLLLWFRRKFPICIGR